MCRYTLGSTDEHILLNSKDVWYHADIKRILCLRNTIIYLHHMAWVAMTAEFALVCSERNIHVEVVF